jgi:predicted RNase H-like HicB family nuclease/SAM-dependent methyltransferase
MTPTGGGKGPPDAGSKREVQRALEQKELGAELEQELQRLRELPWSREVVADDQGVYTARVPELADCTAVGSTATDALDRLGDAIAAHLRRALVDGRAIPQPRLRTRGPSGRLAVRLRRNLHQQLIDRAELERVSLNQYVVTLLMQGLSNTDGPSSPLMGRVVSPIAQLVDRSRRATSRRNVRTASRAARRSSAARLSASSVTAPAVGSHPRRLRGLLRRGFAVAERLAFPEAPSATEQWQRVVMNEVVTNHIMSLNPGTCSAVEISGSAHGDRPWESYTSLNYPEFDLCAPLTQDRRFDVVICEQVLEHVVDPEAAAANLRNLCAPGGHVIVTTPFLIKVHELPMYAMHDYWRFTPRGLRVFLERAGLIVDTVEGWGNRLCVVGNLVRWSAYRSWHSLGYQPDLQFVVWAFARNPPQS